MSNSLSKKRIALKNINKKNYFQYDCVIEQNQPGIYSDYVFLTLGEYSGKKITMQMRLFEFAAFRMGIKELLSLEKINIAYELRKHYYKETQSTKKTALFLGYTKDNIDSKFYINLKEEDSKVSITFDKYEIRALVDSIDNFIKFSENKYFNLIYNLSGK